MHQAGMGVAARGLAGLLAVAAIGGGASYAGSVVRRESMIDPSTAEDFAILDAGVAEEEISGMRSKLEREDGEDVYDIRFYVDGYEYEYEIRAKDGEVLEKSVEREKDPTGAGAAAASAAGKEEPADTEPAGTGAEQAPQGQQEGQQEGQQGGNREPADPGRRQEAAAAGYISVDEAKEIALQDAGRREEEVRFSTAKLDDDEEDGDVYEIEFYAGDLEYEYEIDARTGRIVEFSVEKDDD